MGKNTRLGLSLLCCLMLAACSGKKQTAELDDGPLTPMPRMAAIIDPNDGLLMQAIDRYIHDKKGPAYSRYEFTRIDLDHDGRREGLVMLQTPFQSWCNRDGCSLVVFKAANNGFTLQSEIAPVRGPLLVSENSTNGWRDLIIALTGRPDAARDVVLQFNGRTYPHTPDTQPAVYAMNTDAPGIRIFP